MSFVVDTENIERARRMLAGIPGGADKAIARAINKSASKAVTEVIKGIRKNYRIQSPKARKYGTYIARAKPGNLAAKINIKGRVLSLSYFDTNPKEPAREVPFARVKKGGGGNLPRAFVAQMKTGHIGVFERSSQKMMRGKGPRRKKRGEGRTKGVLAIRELYGPSAAYMAKNEEIHASMALSVRNTFNTNLEAQISKMLARG